MALLLLAALGSCAPQVLPLYTWGSYEQDSYNYLHKANEESIQNLLLAYQEVIENQEGSRETTPPGICADYGFLLLQLDRVAEGKAMLEKEIELYPESKVFVDRILKLIE